MSDGTVLLKEVRQDLLQLTEQMAITRETIKEAQTQLNEAVHRLTLEEQQTKQLVDKCESLAARVLTVYHSGLCENFTLTIKPTCTVQDLFRMAVEHMSDTVDSGKYRILRVAKRCNDTVRPSRPFSEEERLKTIADVFTTPKLPFNNSIYLQHCPKWDFRFHPQCLWSPEVEPVGFHLRMDMACCTVTFFWWDAVAKKSNWLLDLECMRREDTGLLRKYLDQCLCLEALPADHPLMVSRSQGKPLCLVLEDTPNAWQPIKQGNNLANSRVVQGDKIHVGYGSAADLEKTICLGRGSVDDFTIGIQAK